MTTTLLGTQTLNTTSGTHTVIATPAVGDLIIIIRANTGNITSTTPTDTQSGTYTKITSALKATSADLMEVYVRNSLITSATSITFSDAAGTTTGGGLAVLKITGATTPGSAAIRQSAAQANQAASTTPTPVFSSAALTTSTIIGAVFNATSAATMTPRGTPAYTELFDVGYSTPTTGLEVMKIDTGETGTSIAWGSTSASAFCSLVIEVINQTPPTVALNTPADLATGVSTTPTLNATGTDANADTIEYEVQVDTVSNFGGALQFDGSQNYLDLGTLGSLGSNLASGFYCEFQFKTTKTTSQSFGVLTVTGKTTIEIDLNQDDAGNGVTKLIHFYMRDENGAQMEGGTTVAYNFTDGALHTITITVNPATPSLAITIDGASQAVTLTQTGHLATFVNFPISFYIGCWNNLGVKANFFNGTLDNFKIGTSAASLYATYAMNEKTGTTTADGTGNGNTATLSGSPLPAWVESLSHTVDALSTTDAGFTAGHPFASGVATNYTVQSALANNTTYYWRVRASDPLGSNTFGAWATTRSFTTTSGGGGTPFVSFLAALGVG